MSDHDPHPTTDEWKRVIATAALAGVVIRPFKVKRHGGPRWEWHAFMPDGNGFLEASKYKASLRALTMLGDGRSFLPDAASPQVSTPN